MRTIKQIVDKFKNDRRIRGYRRNKILLVSDDCIINDSEIVLIGSSRLRIGKGCRILGSRIELKNAEMVLGAACTISEASFRCGSRSIKNCEISVEANTTLERYEFLIDGTLHIGEKSRFSGDDKSKLVVRRDGSLSFGQEAMVTGTEVIVLDKATLNIGNWFGIGPGSELRAASNIDIGDFVLISYGVTIFDTNTHSTDWRIRQKEILASRGRDSIDNCVRTSDVRIGSNSWIGKNAVILRGAIIGERSIVGIGAIVGAGHYPEDAKIVGCKAKPIAPEKPDEEA
ncbi:MAG: acyltransferase [Rectinemataceae bacterium]